MAEGELQQVLGSDIESLEQKLREFNQTLAPNEQMVLEWLIARAVASPDEVQGYTLPGTVPLTASKIAFNLALGIGGPISPATQYADKWANGNLHLY